MKFNAMTMGIYIGLRSMGVVLEDTKFVDGKFTVYITVPSDTYHVSATGEKMAGAYLAKRVQETLDNMKVPAVVKYKMRDEVWTKEKSEMALEAAQKELMEV
jgi:hypothetical protein